MVATLAEHCRNINRVLLPSVIITVFIVLFVLPPRIVHQSSMRPTMEENDRAFTLSHRFIFSLERGDIIIFFSPKGDERFIKRIIGMPGERIELRGDGSVLINGALLEEPYIRETQPAGPFYQIVIGGMTTPEHSYYVMGDNRSASNDSRNFGPIPENRIDGKFLFFYWPFNKIFSDSLKPHLHKKPGATR